MVGLSLSLSFSLSQSIYSLSKALNNFLEKYVLIDLFFHKKFNSRKKSGKGGQQSYGYMQQRSA